MESTRSRQKNDDLFREELSNMINTKHELCVLREKVDWDRIEPIINGWFPSLAGRPAKSAKLIAGLFILKQTFDVSDEDLPRRWVENPYWQYFCGERYFQHTFPIHPTSMTKWRNKMREEDCEDLLSMTVDVAIKTKTIKKRDLNRVKRI